MFLAGEGSTLRAAQPPCRGCFACCGAVVGLDHGVGHPPAASGPRHRTATLEARRVRGRRREAERSPMAETVREAHERFPRFFQERCAAIVPAPGVRHIGGAAYCVWASPPTGACTTHRHGAVHRRTTSALTTSRQRVVP